MTMTLAIGVKLLVGVLLLNGAAASDFKRKMPCATCGKRIEARYQAAQHTDSLWYHHNCVPKTSSNGKVTEAKALRMLSIPSNFAVSQSRSTMWAEPASPKTRTRAYSGGDNDIVSLRELDRTPTPVYSGRRSSASAGAAGSLNRQSGRNAQTTLDVVGAKCKITVMDGATKTQSKERRRFRCDPINNILYSHKTVRKATEVGVLMETIDLNNVAKFKKMGNKIFLLTINDSTMTYTFTTCSHGGNVNAVATYIKNRLRGDQIDEASFGQKAGVTVVDRRRRLVERLQGF